MSRRKGVDGVCSQSKIPIVDEESSTKTKECVTQQEILEAAEPVLADRFSWTFSSPFYSDRLFDDLGFIGDTKCTQQVLERTYILLGGLTQLQKYF